MATETQQKTNALACLAETLLMGLEGMTSHGSYGAITPEGVQKVLALADKHGFVLADIGVRHGQGF